LWLAGDGNGNDLSGNAHHATVLSGATFVTGKVLDAFSFNGSSGAVRLPVTSMHGQFASGMTIDAWVYALSHGADTVAGGAYGRTVGSNTDTDGFALRVRNGYPQVDIRLSGGNVLQIFGASPIPLNQWVHVAMTYDGAQIRVYVNGAQVGSQAASGVIKNGQNQSTCFMVGNEPAGCGVQASGFGWHGYLDEVEVLNRALTQAEVQAIFAADSAGKCKP
ncbi:MAG TPA: LamG domain-containing protein, partial [Pyrinomonadaceae bacterium]|nr:LamG domain-containing protein [Pyrinomonadaceae bacterium]